MFSWETYHDMFHHKSTEKGSAKKNHLATFCIPILYVPVHHPSCWNSELGLTAAQPRSERPRWLRTTSPPYTLVVMALREQHNLTAWDTRSEKSSFHIQQQLRLTAFHKPRPSRGTFLTGILPSLSGTDSEKSPFSCHGACTGQERPHLWDCTE